MSMWVRDLRFALRVLGRRPLFTALVVTTIALAIGINTVIFSAVDAVLFRPLPFPEADELVFISERNPQIEMMSVALPNYADWRQQAETLEEIGLFQVASANVTGTDQPERLQAVRFTSSLFDVLGVEPELGQLFGEREDQPGAEPTVVLSHQFWQRRFAGDPEIVGSTLNLDGRVFRVAGVMPPQFQFPILPSLVDVWQPLGLFSEPWKDARGNHPGTWAVGRLAEGTTVAQAQAELDTIADRLAREYPDTNAESGARLVELKEPIVSDSRQALLVLLGAVGFVLLIACANVANLLLVRASAREQELAVRTSLGAARGQIARQLLTESLILALMGGAAGLLLALVGIRFLVSSSPESILRLSEAGIDWRVTLFTLALSVLTGLLLGLAPMFSALRPDLRDALKEGGQSRGGTSRNRARSVLVVAEIALALVLLTGAALMVQSLGKLLREDPGFETDGVLTFAVSLPSQRYPDAVARINFLDRLLQSTEALPGVESATVATPLPLAGFGWQAPFEIEGRAPQEGGSPPLADLTAVSPGYFRTMGISLLRGEAFDTQDDADAPAVGIVDETFAELYWPGDDPLGKRLRIASTAQENEWIRVIGVVDHVKNYGVGNDSRVQLYRPYPQVPLGTVNLALRTGSDPQALIQDVRRTASRIDPDLPLYDLTTMEEILSESLAARNIAMVLLSVFALLALILAGVGIYGVMSYVVSQRTREIGLRIALGAQRGQVLSMVVRRTLLLAAVGAVIGAAAAVIMGQVWRGLLYGVGATDPVTLVVAAVVLGLVSLTAGLVPARRASRVSPAVALRYE